MASPASLSACVAPLSCSPGHIASAASVRPAMARATARTGGARSYIAVRHIDDGWRLPLRRRAPLREHERHRPRRPVVGMARHALGQRATGWWRPTAEIFTFGDAGRSPDPLERHRLNAAVVGMAATPSGQRRLARRVRRRLFSFGDASLLGFGRRPPSERCRSWAWRRRPRAAGTGWSCPTAACSASEMPVLRLDGLHPPEPARGRHGRRPLGEGLLAVAADGGAFDYGGAAVRGLDRLHPPQPALDGMAPGRRRGGYWLVAADGGIFTFGSRPLRGIGHRRLQPAPGRPARLDRRCGAGPDRLRAERRQHVGAPSPPTRTTARGGTRSSHHAGRRRRQRIHSRGPSRTEGTARRRRACTPSVRPCTAPTRIRARSSPTTSWCGDWWDEDSASPGLQHLPARRLRVHPSFRWRLRSVVDGGQRLPVHRGHRLQLAAHRVPGLGHLPPRQHRLPHPGCVSLCWHDLDAVLDWFNPALHPVIVMGPDSAIRSF